MSNIEIKEYKKNLSAMQLKLKNAKIPVMVVIEGYAAAGKGLLVNKLISELDPRFVHVSLLSNILKERERYPFLYPYFKAIPENGKIEFMNSFYIEELANEIVEEDIKEREISLKKEQINSYEKTLRDNGYLVVKFFIDIDEDVQKYRQTKLRRDANTEWKVKKEDLLQNDHYSKWEKAYESVLEDTAEIFSWNILDGNDKKKMISDAFRILNDEIAKVIEAGKYEGEAYEKEFSFPEEKLRLDDADLRAYLEDSFYKVELKKEQKKLSKLQNIVYKKKIPVVIAYEGWDAAGKGGNIKRIGHCLDARGFDIFPIASPEPHEKNRHFLWRFWNKVPRTGHIAIFDRTWYGRVMVERIEGFCSENDWKRAYNEINEFEKELTDWGAVLIKFWIHIDNDTQLERFTARENTPEKKWKITDEDWRNRDKWDIYYSVVNEMLEKTSTTNAPWYVIESNDKKYARIKTLRILNKSLEEAIDMADRR